MYDIENLNEMNTIPHHVRVYIVEQHEYKTYMNENAGNPLTKKNGSKNLATTC